MFHILIVEDDPQIHTLLHEIMHHEYNVLHAYDGAEGLQMIRSQMPDIVISDIRMPEMDGIALCKTVKNDPQLCHVILILLTAKNRIEERIEGYNCGADAYINKPFRADHLISIIHNQQANRDRMKAFFHSQNPAPEQNDDDNDTRIPDSLSEIDRRFLEKLHQYNLTEGIRIKEEINKETALCWSDERLELVGLKRQQRETFFVDIRQDDIPRE